MTNRSGAEVMRGRSLVSATAHGRILRLDAPISFWGGVDPDTGRILDGRHPQAAAELGGRIVVVPETVGSSSSSAIMLELMRTGNAPAGLVLGRVDAILVLGVIVGREMGYPVVPVVLMDDLRPDRFPQDAEAEIQDGMVSVLPAGAG